MDSPLLGPRPFTVPVISSPRLPLLGGPVVSKDYVPLVMGVGLGSIVDVSSLKLLFGELVGLEGDYVAGVKYILCPGGFGVREGLEVSPPLSVDFVPSLDSSGIGLNLLRIFLLCLMWFMGLRTRVPLPPFLPIMRLFQDSDSGVFRQSCEALDDPFFLYTPSQCYYYA